MSTIIKKTCDVPRKKFCVPREWEKNTEFMELMKYKYDMSTTKESLDFIENHLKSMGYTIEDNHRMLRDYLYFMLIDVLIKSDHVFITREDVDKSSILNKFLSASTPDFMIKRSERNKKTLIIGIYTGNGDINPIKSEYRKVSYFSDFKIVTQHNFSSELKELVNREELDVLYNSFRILSVEYRHWCAFLRFKKIMFSKTDNIEIKASGLDDSKFLVSKNEYQVQLEKYATSVLDQENI